MKKMNLLALVAMLSVHAIGFSVVYQFAYGDNFSKTAIVDVDLAKIKLAPFSTAVFQAIPEADRPADGQVLQLLADDKTTVLMPDTFEEKIFGSDYAGTNCSNSAGCVPVGTSFYVTYVAAPAVPDVVAQWI